MTFKKVHKRANTPNERRQLGGLSGTSTTTTPTASTRTSSTSIPAGREYFYSIYLRLLSLFLGVYYGTRCTHQWPCMQLFPSSPPDPRFSSRPAPQPSLGQQPRRCHQAPARAPHSRRRPPPLFKQLLPPLLLPGRQRPPILLVMIPAS